VSARAVAVVVEKKFAGRWQLFICNDHHVGNASAVDGSTLKDFAFDSCAKIRFCRATVLVIPLQDNRPHPKAGEESRVSLDRNALKQEQC